MNDENKSSTPNIDAAMIQCLKLNIENKIKDNTKTAPKTNFNQSLKEYSLISLDILNLLILI